MLGDVSLLLHEITAAVRIRRHTRENQPFDERALGRQVTIVVTGLPSSGKARLVDSLRARIAAAQFVVRTAPSSSSGDAPSLHVHAETDVEALIEGGLKTIARQDAQRADLIVPVDWESTDRSVDRVIAALHARGPADVEAGV